MSVIDLSDVLPGLEDPAFGSQAAFRAALQALSCPGTLVDGGRAALYWLGLALLDQDTPVWLSPAARSLGASLRFHTGCPLVDDAGSAAYVLVGAANEMPALDRLALGTDEAPQRSVTLIVEVGELSTHGQWRLSGPGIPGIARLSVPALGASFLAEWHANARRFPRGVDILLCAGGRLCGLPRTTRIEG